MSRLFFKINGASNPSSHARTASTARNYPKSSTKLVAGTAMIFTSEKRSEDSTTGKRNDILASGKTDFHCKVKAGVHMKAVFWLVITALAKISRLRFKQSRISMLIPEIYVLGRFVNFLVTFRYIWR